MLTDATTQFADAIRSAGMTPPDFIEADGELHRFAPNGTRHDDAGWYVLHGDGIPAGSFGDWRTGLSETWRADIGRKLSPAEALAQSRRIEESRRKRDAEETRRRAEACERAKMRWKSARSADPTHPYLVRKGIAPCGTRQEGALLLIPMRDGLELHSLQTIDADGEKRFLSGGRVVGCYFSIGTPKETICIVEGFATGASVHGATGYPVAVAFNAGNLEAVARTLRENLADVRIILCADDDHRTDGNPGRTKANAAALAVDGLVALPDFGLDRPSSATDFNDMAQLCGGEAIKRAIESARQPEASKELGAPRDSVAVDSDGWPAILPLVAKIESQPYPLDALPPTIRAAIEEVQAFVKAPVALIAASALTAVSAAAQAHIDVKRAERLQSPSGIFMLTVGDSGERKSTCDRFFSEAIGEYEQRQREAAKPELAGARAKLEAWTARRDGIKDAIRVGSKAGKPTSTLEQQLHDLEYGKPSEARYAMLLRGDATPEHLAHSLAHQWSSAAVISAEAGAIFGAHGMGRESIMRNLALLNTLWDGNDHKVGRRTSESFTVSGARLTIGLQVQEATLRAFLGRDEGLARGTGFFARCLIAWPDSTQGTRTYCEAPPSWPALQVFNRRITAILERAAPIEQDGTLHPQVLEFSPAAKSNWISSHDTIESELREGGEAHDVRDVASKTADNASRLAALFHLFEGNPGAISAEAFDGASRIAAWHLNEARRFFGELALPSDLADAIRVDQFVTRQRRAGIDNLPRRELRQYGPVRDKARLDTALRELVALGRIREVAHGRQTVIQLNPALHDSGAP